MSINQNLSENQAFLENMFLLENLQGGIVYSDFEPPFHLRYATEGMAKLTGYCADDLKQMTQMDIVHEDDQELLTEDVGRQLAEGDTFEVEYRLKRKDGSAVYVLDRAKVVEHEDGRKYIHCLLTDISAIKQMEQALRLNEEKYKIAIEQSGNAILEYELATHTLHFSENYRQLFGCDAPMGTLEEIMQAGWVDKVYETLLPARFKEVANTGNTQSMELQVHTTNGTLVWCSLYLVPMRDHGALHCIVGCLKNINAEKHNLERLTRLSLRDCLTGVHNRYAVERFVQERLLQPSTDQVSCLVVLDIDRFKQINDEYGHDCGDEVLIALSQTMTALLPPSAVFGRLGGDEFLVFLMLPKDDVSLTAMLAHMAAGVHARFINEQLPITLSMGAAWQTDTCNTFKALYKNADVALYETKNRGRNGYTIFQQTV